MSLNRWLLSQFGKSQRATQIKVTELPSRNLIYAILSGKADLAIGLVEKRPLMLRLPGTKRTWLGFRGGSYSGANLFAFGSPDAARAVALWRSVEQDRKKGWRMIASLGPALLAGAVLRLRTLDQTLASMGKRLELDIRKVELSDPLAAVDVDKPADHALVSAILEGRA